MTPSGYSIRIVAKHPDMDLGAVTTAIGLQPTRQWKKGDRPISRTSSFIGAPYNYSLWTARFDPPALDLRKSIVELVIRLHNASDFIKGITITGGSVSLYIDLDGRVNIGVVFDGSVISYLHDLKVQFGFEVYPYVASVNDLQTGNSAA